MPYKTREVLAKLQRAGFMVRRQSGSHVVLRHAYRRRVNRDISFHSQTIGID